MKLKLTYKNSTVGYEGEITDLTSSFVYLKSTKGHTTGLSISACTPVWVEVPYYVTNVILHFQDNESDDERWKRVRNLAQIHVKGVKERTISVGKFSNEPKPILFTYDEKLSSQKDLCT